MGEIETVGKKSLKLDLIAIKVNESSDTSKVISDSKRIIYRFLLNKAIDMKKNY